MPRILIRISLSRDLICAQPSEQLQKLNIVVSVSGSAKAEAEAILTQCPHNIYISLEHPDAHPSTQFSSPAWLEEPRIHVSDSQCTRINRATRHQSSPDPRFRSASRSIVQKRVHYCIYTWCASHAVSVFWENGIRSVQLTECAHLAACMAFKVYKNSNHILFWKVSIYLFNSPLIIISLHRRLPTVNYGTSCI